MISFVPVTLAALLLIIGQGCKKNDEDTPSTPVPDGYFTDTRDGRKYPFVIIDDQVWMAKNLNYAADNSLWYNNEIGNGDIYGRLYDWETACKVCPSGWHLPSDAEWQRLVDILRGEYEAGGKLKETGISHWASPNTGAADKYGFTALPGGLRDDDNRFRNLGEIAIFWSSLQFYTNNAWARYLYYEDGKVTRIFKEKDCFLSVRCIRN